MKINKDIVPSTIEKAVEEICEALSEEDRKFILNDQSKGASIHFSIGKYLRNEWSLWSPDSPLKRDAVEKYSIAHADDISGLILSWVYAKVKEEEFNPIKEVNIYHKHWESFGLNSLEAGGWPPK